jgi:hypothetical protein
MNFLTVIMSNELAHVKYLEQCLYIATAQLMLLNLLSATFYKLEVDFIVSLSIC